MTRFSIVIPCYNAERWLSDTIQSCVSQTARDLEVIVVDDGSTDSSHAIAATAARTDPRIRVIRQENQGVGAARNAGLAIATGDYVNFVDADDLILPDKLAAQGAVLDDNPRIDCVVCDGSGIDAAGRVVMDHLVDPRRLAGPVSLFDLFFSGGQFPPLIPLIRRRVAVAAGGFDVDRRLAGWADTAFWLRAGLAGATHHFLDRQLCQYRIHPASMSANHDAMEQAARGVYAHLLRDQPDASARSLRFLHGRLNDNETALAALRGCVAGLHVELRDMAGHWRVTRETLHADRVEAQRMREAWQAEQLSAEALRQQLLDAHDRLDRLRAMAARDRRSIAPTAPPERSGHRMRMVIFDAGDTGRRLWEALVSRPAIDVVAFVDPDARRQGRTFLDVPVHGPEWLRGGEWDHVAVAASAANEWRFPLAAAGVVSRQIIECPTDEGDAFLAEIVAEMFPDRMAGTIASAPFGDGIRIGVFGTGAAAMKVWEALADLDSADAVWFADNNPEQQGRDLLGLNVIAPSEIPGRPFDAIVVGSMSRGPIRDQLLTLGVPGSAVLTPEVTAPAADLRRQLAALLAAWQADRIPPRAKAAR